MMVVSFKIYLDLARIYRIPLADSVVIRVVKDKFLMLRKSRYVFKGVHAIGGESDEGHGDWYPFSSLHRGEECQKFNLTGSFRKRLSETGQRVPASYGQ